MRFLAELKRLNVIRMGPGLDTLRQHPRYLALAAAHEKWKQQAAP